MADYNKNLVFNGLGTQSISCDVAGIYFVEGKLSLPTIVGGAGASSCVVVVNQNGSAKYTGSAGAEGFYVNLLCAVGDVIAIVLSSAAAPDLVLNAIKASISIGLGE